MHLSMIHIIDSKAFGLVADMTGQFSPCRQRETCLVGAKEKLDEVKELGLASDRCLEWTPSWKRA